MIFWGNVVLWTARVMSISPHGLVTLAITMWKSSAVSSSLESGLARISVCFLSCCATV